MSYKFPEEVYLKLASKPGVRPWGECWEYLVDLVHTRDGGICSTCGDNQNLEVHHIIPLAEGGNSLPSNLTLLCEPCHKYEHSRIRAGCGSIKEQILQIQNYVREMTFFDNMNGLCDCERQ